MITDWRAAFNNYNLYFDFVLLAAYKAGGNPAWPLIRDAQLAALALPMVGVSSAQDLGDEISPQGSIHPRNKTIVGERLSLAMQHDIYGQNVVSTGPVVNDITWPIDTSAIQTVILRFSSSLMNNQGLQLLDTSGCTVCCRNMTGSAFTVTTSDNVIHRTTVNVNADAYVVLVTVDLTRTPSAHVMAVQHNWEAYPECSLYNSAHIPQLPLNVTRL